MEPTEAHQLIDYHFRAHRQVWACIEALPDEAQFIQHVGYSMGSLRAHAVHTMFVDWRWIRRITGETLPAAPNAEAYPTRADVRAQWDTIETEIRAAFEALTTDDLARVIEYDMPHRGGVKRSAVWQIVSHLVNHGTDHRAQMLATLHLVGGKTIEQDMMFYFWELNGTPNPT